jgi:hypothetical protein
MCGGRHNRTTRLWRASSISSFVFLYDFLVHPKAGHVFLLWALTIQQHGGITEKYPLCILSLGYQSASSAAVYCLSPEEMQSSLPWNCQRHWCKCLQWINMTGLQLAYFMPVLSTVICLLSIINFKLYLPFKEDKKCFTNVSLNPIVPFLQASSVVELFVLFFTGAFNVSFFGTPNFSEALM